MMRGDFVQSGRRGILDVLAGETHTIRHLMGGDHLDERLADAGAGHRHRGLVGERAATRQRRITHTTVHLVGDAASGRASGDIALGIARHGTDGAMLLPLIATGLSLGQGLTTLFGHIVSLSGVRWMC